MWKQHFYSELVHGVDRTFLRVIATWLQWGSSGCCQITAWSWGVLSQGNMWLGKSLRLFIFGAWVISRERKVGEWQKDRWLSPHYSQTTVTRVLCTRTEQPAFSSLLNMWPTHGSLRWQVSFYRPWNVVSNNSLAWVWCGWAERIFAIFGKLCTALVFYKGKAFSFGSICVHLFYSCLMVPLRIDAGEGGRWGENEESLWFYFPGLSLKDEKDWGNAGPLSF